MIKLTDILAEVKRKLKYTHDAVAHYDGQTNYELGVYKGGEIIGLVEYVVFDGEIQVSMIQVVPEYRRKGIASRLIQRMKELHPDAEYKPSMQTDDGAKFKHKDIPDSEMDTIDEAYDDVSMDYIKRRKKYTEYTNIADRKTKNGIGYLHFTFNDSWHTWGEIKAFDLDDGTEVGRVSYGKKTEDDDLKASVDVRSDFRRKGIATEMYDWVEELTGEELHPDTPHSDSASKFWKSRRANKSISESTISRRNPFKEVADRILQKSGAYLRHVSKNGIGSVYVSVPKIGEIRISDHFVQSRSTIHRSRNEVEIKLNMTSTFDIDDDGHYISGRTHNDVDVEELAESLGHDPYDISLQGLYDVIDQLSTSH